MSLRIPGPTECPPEVLGSLSKQMINHRGEEFGSILKRVTENLQKVFYTENDILLLTCSGTGGLEAAVSNFLSPGEKVLAVSVGFFGDRFATIASRYGVDVKILSKPWGTPVYVWEIFGALKNDPDITTVILTHNETSTGVTNDLKHLAKTIKAWGKLLIVDAVSSLSAIPVYTDDWGLDVVITGSQKGWMAPPGMAMVAVNKTAWEAYGRSRMPRYYFDLGKARDAYQVGQTAWTPGLPVFFALDVSLGMILEEGMENVFIRHKKAGEKLRAGLRKIGLTVPVEEAYASNTVTLVKLPGEINSITFAKIMLENSGIEVAEGLGEFAGNAIRIGHMGLVDEEDINGIIDAVRAALGYFTKRA